MNLTTRTACTSILVGKKASLDGSIMIGRNEDSKAAWPKHFIVHPASKTNNSIFKSKANKFECELPENALKYTATPEWTDKFGLFEEYGFNSLGVAMSATESAYANPTVLSYDPFNEETGILEEAMITVVLPYIDSARAGVKLLGKLVETHGSAECNGILFGDQSEAWYMEIGSGHHWVAQRIPDDSYAVVSNQLAIQTVDFSDEQNFLFDSNLREFALENHLWQKDQPFNFRRIFGTRSEMDTHYNTPRVWYGQKYFNPSLDQDPTSQNLSFIKTAEFPIQLTDVTFLLSSHYNGTKYDPVGHGKEKNKHQFRPISLAKTQESHVLQIRPNFPADYAGIQWLAMGVAAESSYIPFYSGITETPSEYHVGKVEYTPDSAYWIYKHVGVLLDAHFNHFNQELNDVQDQTFRQTNAIIQQTDRKLQNEPDLNKRTEIMNEAGKKVSSIGIKNYQTFASHLITQLTDLSPLNYNTDQNL